jgi:hypothetical protein
MRMRIDVRMRCECDANANCRQLICANAMQMRIQIRTTSPAGQSIWQERVQEAWTLKFYYQFGPN